MDRFVADTSLDFVARRLRFLGFDVLTLPGARLEDLFERAQQEDRIVLTLSARRPPRFAEVAVLRVPRADPVAAVRAVAAAHAPSGAPFSRCALCNTPLQRRLAVEAQGEVPGRVLRGAEELDYCPTCGKWYWEGSHVARVREWLARTLGDALPG